MKLSFIPLHPVDFSRNYRSNHKLWKEARMIREIFSFLTTENFHLNVMSTAHKLHQLFSILSSSSAFYNSTKKDEEILATFS